MSTSIRITTVDELKAAHKTYGIPLPKRGAIGRKALITELINRNVSIDPTPFFNLGHLTGASPIPRGEKRGVVYVISYRIVTKHGRPMPTVLTAEMSESQILELTPFVKGRITEARATIALATAKRGDGIADAQRYAVESVKVKAPAEQSSSDAPTDGATVDAESNAESAADPGESTDTPEASTDAESVTDARELVTV